MARLSLSLLGGFEATLDGEPTTAFEYDKVRALLAYLSVEGNRPHRREMLAGLLWPNRPEANARQNLSQVLFSLRHTIGDRHAHPPFLIITPQTLQFNAASDYSLDVTTFIALLDDFKARHHHRLDNYDVYSEKLQQAMALYRGEFLEGFSVPDSSAFEEWLLINRERLHRLAVEALHHLVDYYQGRNDFEEALQYAWRQIELEPWRENAHQQLMRLLVLSGQREAALTQYETCRRLLNEELGIEPAEETTRLYRQIRSGEKFSPLPPRPPASLPSFPTAIFQPATSQVPFVARERELGQLDRLLDLALSGQGRPVFITGGPGRGKTFLMREFAQRAQASCHELIVAGGNGNAHTGVGDPYLPFREVLELLTADVEARWAVGAITQDYAERLWRLLPVSIQVLLDDGPDLVDTFLSGANLVKRARTFAPDEADWLIRLEQFLEWRAANPGPTAPQQSDLFEQYSRVLHTLARQKPLLLLLDDLQWADLGSVNLLFHLGRQIEHSRVLIVGAYRPAEIISQQNGRRHPLETVVHEFRHRFGDVEVDLSQADGRQFINAFLDTVPNRLDNAFRQTLYRHTEGHPLFTVEVLRSMQERGDLVKDRQDRWIEGSTLDWKTLSPQVEASLAERIGQLPGNLQELLAIASVEGEIFTAEALARVQASDAREVVRCLSEKLGRKYRLVAAQEIRQVDGQLLSHYRFRHILFQKYLYGQLDPAERVYLHQAVGLALESLYGDQSEQVAVQLARHFQEAKNPEKAVAYLHQAGERAVRMSANGEAITHLTRGLALLERLPESPERARQELALKITLSMPLMAVEGYGAPEVGHVYSRIEELSQQLGEVPLQFRALFFKHNFYGQRGELYKSYQIARQALSLAKQKDDPVLFMLAHFMEGVSLLYLGKAALARTHLEQIMEIYDPQQHRDLAFSYGQDIGVSGLSWLAWTLWALGYPDQGLQCNQKALTLAQELDHPLTLAHTLGVATTTLHHLGQDVEMTRIMAEACIGHTTEHRFPLWLAIATIYGGWVLVEQGQTEAGLAQMCQGLTDYRATDEKLGRSLFLTILAEVYGKTGEVETGLSLLTEALVTANQSGECLVETEIYRLRGELLLKSNAETRKASSDSPEACFLHAVKIARAQQAKTFELRATMSLCRLWKKQGKREKARQILAEIYNWFTEGFDTADLKEAKALLEELS